MFTVFELGWGNYYALPNDKVSKFLELWEQMVSVDSMYVDNELLWYYKDNPRKITMQLVPNFMLQSHAEKLLAESKEQTNGA